MFSSSTMGALQPGHQTFFLVSAGTCMQVVPIQTSNHTYLINKNNFLKAKLKNKLKWSEPKKNIAVKNWASIAGGHEAVLC